MPQGTVKVWNGLFGYVKLDDKKELCYVHKKDVIGGDALKQGLKVTVGKVEEVEGHKGRVKGLQVKGPAVISKEKYEAEVKALHETDEWKQKQKEKRDKKKAKKQRQKLAASGGLQKQALTGDVAGLSAKAKKKLIARLQGELGGGGGGGDKRRDPSDPGNPQLFTRQEFMDYHGQQRGTQLWNQAAPKPVPQKTQQGGERRRDPSDPGSSVTYTIKEFIDCHGQSQGQRLWNQAAPRAGAAGRGAALPSPGGRAAGGGAAKKKNKKKKKAGPQKRKDPSDPRCQDLFTFEEFKECHGEKEAHRLWALAGGGAAPAAGGRGR